MNNHILDLKSISKHLLNILLLNAEDISQTILFVQAGADVNYQDFQKRTPLLNAHTFEQTKFLVDMGADIFHKDDSLHTALMEASCIEQTKFFIEKGIEIDAKDKCGNTALMYSLTYEQTAFLIENGANVNHTNEKGQSVIMMLDLYEQWELLLNNNNINICHSDFYGRSVLLYADTIEKGKLLLEKGVDINSTYHGGSILMNTDISASQIDMLINLGADIEIEDPKKQTALFYHSDIDKIKLLLKAGVDINHRNFEGKTVLICADRSCYLYYDENTIKFLIENGADPNIEDDEGNTAIFYTRELLSIKILFKSGININHKNNDGTTVLMTVLEDFDNIIFYNPSFDMDDSTLNIINILNFLIESGADPNIEDNEGNTALFYCHNKYALQIFFKTIEDNNIKININHKDSDGKTFLETLDPDDDSDRECIDFLLNWKQENNIY